MSDAGVWFAGLITRELVRGVRDVSALRVALSDRALVNSGFDLAQRNADDVVTDEILKRAKAAADAIATNGPAAKLDAADEAALEVFVLLVARPALFVQNGEPKGRPDNWREVGRDIAHVGEMVAGVGRIQTASAIKIGTGFIVGDRRVLTNNHVVCALLGDLIPPEVSPDRRPEFWRDRPGDFATACDQVNERWRDVSNAPVFELHGEVDLPARTSVARIVRVIAHHGDVDMAVLEIANDLPDGRRLVLATDEPAELPTRRIYAVGYPIDDVRNFWNRRITPAHMLQRVFGANDATLGTKRLSPGTAIGWRGDNKAFLHDASTLPGSSGSCIVDFEESEVIGLHFGGSFQKRHNFAVPLWRYCNDRLLIDNGVIFGERA